MSRKNKYMSKGKHGWEGNVGSLVVVCKARCGLAVKDTSEFVELHNILQKILLCFGILFLANSRRNNSIPSMTASEPRGSRLLLGALRPRKIPTNYDYRIPPQLAQVNKGSLKIEQKALQLKRTFSKGIAVGLCLSRYGSPYSKMGRRHQRYLQLS